MKKIPLSGRQEGLQEPFSGLDIPGLPPGPSDVAPLKKIIPERMKLTFRREKAKRGGKSVIIVSGFDPLFPSDAIENIARKIRKQCGCGGTVLQREIEFQGDDPERFRKIFHNLL